MAGGAGSLPRQGLMKSSQDGGREVITLGGWRLIARHLRNRAKKGPRSPESTWCSHSDAAMMTAVPVILLQEKSRFLQPKIIPISWHQDHARTAAHAVYIATVQIMKEMPMKIKFMEAVLTVARNHARRGPANLVLQNVVIILAPIEADPAENITDLAADQDRVVLVRGRGRKLL